jgi:hypothetical protein
MRALIAALAVGAVLCALPSAAALGADSGSAATTAKHCNKHKRKHSRRHHKRRHHHKHCRGSQGAGGGLGGGPGSSSAKCTSDPSNPGRVGAHEFEYSIVLTRPKVACGTTIVEQQNTGMDGHDLVLQKVGDAVPSFAFGEIGPGAVASQTLDLAKGNWTLYCSILDHRSRGMEVNLVVE